MLIVGEECWDLCHLVFLLACKGGLSTTAHSRLRHRTIAPCAFRAADTAIHSRYTVIRLQATMSGVANKSRFFAGDSDEDSDDRSETSSQPSEEQKPKTTAKPIQSRFAELDEDDSDSDDEDRVVRSEKEKRFDAIQSVIGTLRNHMKINNWVEIEEGLYMFKQLFLGLSWFLAASGCVKALEASFTLCAIAGWLHAMDALAHNN